MKPDKLPPAKLPCEYCATPTTKRELVGNWYVPTCGVSACVEGAEKERTGFWDDMDRDQD